MNFTLTRLLNFLGAPQRKHELAPFIVPIVDVAALLELEGGAPGVLKPSLVEAALANSEYFTGGTIQGPVAAQNTKIQLKCTAQVGVEDPRLLILYRVEASSNAGAATVLHLGQQDVNLATKIGAPLTDFNRHNRLTGADRVITAASEIRWETAAGLGYVFSPYGVARRPVSERVVWDLRDSPILLGPGTGVLVVDATVNTTLEATFTVREVLRSQIYPVKKS